MLNVRRINEDVKQGCLAVLRHVPNPVAIVTTQVGGRPWGVTVSSFLSVTMDPPKVMVSLFSHSRAAQEIQSQGNFGVSVLKPEQQEVAERLSRPGLTKFLEGYVDSHGDITAPRIAGSNHFSCDLDQVMEVDDHVILIGRVTEVSTAESSDTLMYANRTFHRFVSTP